MRTDPKWTFFKCALALIALCLAVGAHSTESRNVIESGLKDAVESGRVLSGVGAIVSGGDARHFGVGRLGPEKGTGPDAATSYQIGSISKAFTNLLLAEMVAAGTVEYETTVAELIGGDVEFANSAVGEITLLELATHTSGLPRLPPNLAIDDPADPYADYGEEELLAALAATRAGQPLGDSYAYSNFGAGLLGYLLGRAHGEGYRAAMVSLVLDPLGLSDSGFEAHTEAAISYNGEEVVPAWRFDAMAAAGALWSTAADMARLARIQLGHEPLGLDYDTDESRRAVASADAGHSVSPVWHVAETPDGPVYWHNGSTVGYRSFFGFRPATDEAVVLLAAGDLDPAGLALKWFGAISEPADPPEFDPQLAGQYQLTSEVGIGVYQSDSGPVAQMTGQSAFDLMSLGDDWYALHLVDASLKFQRENGEVVALELVQGGRRQHARKVADKASVLARRSIELAPERLGEYVGKYSLAPGARFTVRLADEGLEARLGGQSFLRIYPRAEDVFFYKAVDAELHFERDEAGRVDALVLHQGGLEQRAERVE